MKTSISTNGLFLGAHRKAAGLGISVGQIIEAEGLEGMTQLLILELSHLKILKHPKVIMIETSSGQVKFTNE